MDKPSIPVTSRLSGLGIILLTLFGLSVIIFTEYLSRHYPRFGSVDQFAAWFYPLLWLLGLILVGHTVVLGALSGILTKHWPIFIKINRSLVITALVVIVGQFVLQVASLGLLDFLGLYTSSARIAKLTVLNDASIILFIAYSVVFFLAARPLVTKHWEKFQILNYLAFALMLVYGRMASPDLSRWPGSWIWYLLAGTLSIVIAWKLFEDKDKKSTATPNTPNPTVPGATPPATP